MAKRSGKFNILKNTYMSHVVHIKTAEPLLYKK